MAALRFGGLFGLLVLATVTVGSLPASAHVDAPYRSVDPGLVEKFDGTIRGKILTTPGAGGSDGFYVDSVKLPEADLLADAKANNPTAIKQSRGLWKARLRAGMMPPIRWAGALTLLPTAFAAGWKIGALGDRWLEISGPIGIRPSGAGGLLSAFAAWELEPAPSGLQSVPAECNWNGTFTSDNTCFVLNIGTANHGVLNSASISCEGGEWTACVGFTDTQEWVDTYAAMYAYMQTIPVGQLYFRSNSCGSGCVETEAVRIVTESQLEAKLYPTGYAAFSGQGTTLPGPTGIPNELDPSNHYYIGFSRTAAQDSVDAEPGHETEEWINSRLDPEYDPPAGGATFIMPDCVGLSESLCVSQLGLSGWTGELTVGTVTFEGANLALPAEAVVTQTYSPGSQLAVGVAITLELNPNSDDMPILLPDPAAHETYTQYLTRLQTLGYVGTATQVELTDEYADPERGPSEVVTTTPQPQTRIRKDDPVAIKINPPDFGGPIEGAGCTCPTNAVNFGPVSSVNYGESFPFGVFVMAAGILDAFDVSPTAPGWDFNLGDNSAMVPLGSEGHYAFDLSAFDPYMAIMRTLISWVLWIGALWFVGTRLLGFKSAGDPQEAADEALPL